MTDKTLYMLIGPKGAGKTYIGTVVDSHTDIAFVAVEPIWLALTPGEDGWAKVEAVIDATFATRDKVMIESLGAGEAFEHFYANLARKYHIRMIRVYADLDTCLTRVQQRDPTQQIAIPVEQVAAYNRIAATVHYEWALELNNNDLLSGDAIIAAIQTLA